MADAAFTLRKCDACHCPSHVAGISQETHGRRASLARTYAFTTACASRSHVWRVFIASRLARYSLASIFALVALLYSIAQAIEQTTCSEFWRAKGCLQVRHFIFRGVIRKTQLSPDSRPTGASSETLRAHDASALGTISLCASKTPDSLCRLPNTQATSVVASKTQAQKSRMLVVLVAPAPALGTDTLPHTPPVPCRLCLAPPQAIYILCSAFLTTFSAATSHNFPALNPGAAPATSSTFIASFTFITPSIVGAQRLLVGRYPHPPQARKQTPST